MEHYSRPTFLRIKEREQRILNFTLRRQENYNDPITEYEVKNMLRECGNTAPGEDGIHYALLRNLSDSCFEFLLQILNIIFEQGSSR